MILYRGQPTREARQEAEARMPEWLRDALASPHPNRVAMAQAQGRWFTDDPEIARWYAQDARGSAEIVMVEVDDAEAETYRVSNAPVTRCGLEPGRFSRDPEREFMLPAAIAAMATAMEKPHDADAGRSD